MRARIASARGAIKFSFKQVSNCKRKRKGALTMVFVCARVWKAGGQLREHPDLRVCFACVVRLCVAMVRACMLVRSCVRVCLCVRTCKRARARVCVCVNVCVCV